MLHEPRDLEMSIHLDGTGTEPTVTLVDVADADGNVPATLEGYRVEVGS